MSVFIPYYRKTYEWSIPITRNMHRVLLVGVGGRGMRRAHRSSADFKSVGVFQYVVTCSLRKCGPSLGREKRGFQQDQALFQA